MQRVAQVFWNDDETRLRAGWRVLIHYALWVYLPVVLNRLLGGRLVVAVQALAPTVGPWVAQIIAPLITLGAVLAGTWLVVRYLDRRPFADLGCHIDGRWWRDLLFGLLLGGALMTSVFAIQWVVGWVTVVDFLSVTLDSLSFAAAIWAPIISFIVVGITEEILARGYQLRNLAEGLNGSAGGPRRAVVWAWALSSLLFGLLHVFNPNSSLVSTRNLVLAGVLLGLGFVLTGSLALPIGLHISWNFFQGNVFGFPVSGRSYPGATVFAVQQGGPDLWTGGAFGPEAGLLGIGAIAIGCVLTIVWVRWQYGQAALQTDLACYRPPVRHKETAA